ncbi:helix-turn-helix domain-containing protein [Pleionea sp. CnH1-48]|uniref:helix-turn-helix domain-containing protein n=1 Tax=Pleionea sp. CnH1-48 TaxID=2954494 RepID=UPI0020978F22|nr:helix-turn-helix domain-containing protein [Pleionea sp. CnH1-48]MCO7223086.1 helix-turn-helix domain-containing protein [Pleionea sp. CnH1-48]
MNYEKIKSLLRKNGFSISIIADAANVSNSHCIRVLKGERTSPRVAAYLSEALQLPVHEIFPDHSAYQQPSAEASMKQEKIKLLRQAVSKNLSDSDN